MPLDPRATAPAVLLLSRDRQVRAALRALLEANATRLVAVASSRAEAEAHLHGGSAAVAVVHLGWRRTPEDAAVVDLLRRRGLRVVVVGGPGASAGSDVPAGAEAVVELDAGPDALLAAVARAGRRGSTAPAG